MRTLLLALLPLLCAVLLAGQALAQPPPPVAPPAGSPATAGEPAAGAYPRKQVFVFGETDPVTGNRSTPEMMVVEGQAGPGKPGSLIRLRRDFLDRLLASADDL